MTSDSISRPLTVVLAAACMSLLALWHFAAKVWPAFTVGDSSALGQLVSFGLTLWVAWGIFTLKSWAWWIGLFINGVGTAIFIAAMGSIDEFQSRVSHAEFDAARRIMSFIGLVCIAGILFLFAPASRTACRQ